jgi:hypothetical protein
MLIFCVLFFSQRNNISEAGFASLSVPLRSKVSVLDQVCAVLEVSYLYLLMERPELGINSLLRTKQSGFHISGDRSRTSFPNL